MEKYQVLARRFRPQNFKEVVGQESVVTVLKNAIRNNRVAHAYLFSGMRGIGKTTLARVLAKALNCKNPTEDLEPCNQCSSCQEISACHSLDVIEIDGASNRGIDDIRKINETVFYAPASGKYKIYIIDEVHMLTKEAFNALLKTLEAPPANVKFFFATTEVHKVLPTILSRTQRLELKSLTFDQIKDHLKMIAESLNRQVTDEALLLVAKHAEGSLRDSLSLFDQLLCYSENLIDEQVVIKVFGLIPTEFFLKLDLSIQNNTPSTVFELVNALLSNGKDLTNFIDHLIEHMRTELHRKISGSPSHYTEPQLLYILEKLVEGQILLQKSPSKQAIVEMLLLQIIETRNFLSLPQLAKKLLLLEKDLKNSAAPLEAHTIQQPPKADLPSDEITSPEVIKNEENTNLAPIIIETEPVNSPQYSPDPHPIIPASSLEPITEETAPDLSPPVETKPAQQAAPATQAPIETQKIQEKPLQSHPSHYDNMMRFTEVELEGIIHKH